MPQAAPRPCTHPGCGVLVRDGTGRCKAHPPINRFADPRRGTRQERGYGSEWDKLRLQILRRDGGLCQPCLAQDRTTRAEAVDHIAPKAEGGTDDPANLQSICRPCHKLKTAAEAARASARASG